MAFRKLAQLLRSGERLTASRDRPRRTARASGTSEVRDLGFAHQPREIAQRLEVGHSGQQHPGPVAVHDRLRLLAVATARLSEIVEDRHELDVVAWRGG